MTYYYSRNATDDIHSNSSPAGLVQLNANESIETMGNASDSTISSARILSKSYINLKLIRKL